MAEVRERRVLRKVWQRTRFPEDKAAFNRQAQRVKTLLREHSEGKWKDLLSSLATQDGSLWKLAKALRRDKPISRPLQVGQERFYSEEDKARVFADTMEKQFSPHDDVRDEDHVELVHGFNVTLQEDDEDDPVPPFTTKEVAEALKKLKPKKAPGIDFLGSPALKDLPAWTLQWITMIYNSCLALRHFPAKWKTAKVILLPKPGKSPLVPENYRPISLLPTLSKVLERLLLSRFPEEFHLSIRHEQYGFRRGHSTELQLSRVVTSMVDATNNSQHTTAVLLDVSKAFDKVWHEGLVYKLAHSPLPKSLVFLLRSYLQDRKFLVSSGTATSSLRPINAGVPQGSVLGPVLYLWYTNDMPLAPRVQLSLYADDSMFWASSIRVHQACTYLQRQLDLLSPWLKKWRTKVNPAKSEAICFTRKQQKTIGRNRLDLEGVQIPWKKTVKYLGVTLDKRLNFNSHVTTQVNKTRAASWKLGPLLRQSSPLLVSTKLLLYASIIRPSLLYGATSWYHLTSKTSRKKLESFQARILRRATNSPWFVRNTVIRDTTGFPTVGDFVRTAAQRMIQAAETSEWGHIRTEAAKEGPPQIILRRPRAILDDPP